MSKHRVQVELDIDDEALAEHLEAANGEQPPYSNNLHDWNFDDVVRAVERDIIDSGSCELDYFGVIE